MQKYHTAARSHGLRIVANAVLLAGAAGTSGCASQASVRGAWAEGVSRPQPFTRVLIVGVSNDMNQRCAFEHFLVRRVESNDTDAYASCDVVDRKEPLTRESIERAVASTHADAVLATILVAKKVSAQEGGSMDTRGSAGYKATDSGWAEGYYGVYGVPVIYGEFQSYDPLLTIKTQVDVSSRVFETKGPSVVYTMTTTARKLESRDEGLAAITTPIADQLRRDKLVK